MAVRKPYKTPIELIFRKVFQREMTPQERRILLGGPRRLAEASRKK
jgi:hypothetical protein